jgi:hypothetical protein
MSAEGTPAPAVPVAPAPEVPPLNHPAAPPPTSPVQPNQPAPPAPVVHIHNPAPPATPDLFQVPKSLWDDLQSKASKLATIEAEQQRLTEEGKRKEAAMLAEKGEWQRALDLRQAEADRLLQTERQKAVEIEDRAKKQTLSGELSKALAGKPLVPGAVSQLYQLFQNQFHVAVDPISNQWVVRTADFKSPEQFVEAQLANPEFAHFLRPSTTGGVMTQGGQATTPTPPAHTPAPPPMTMGDAMVQTMVANRQPYVNGQLANGHVFNPDGTASKQQLPGFGLRPLSRVS